MSSTSPAAFGLDEWRFPVIKDTWRFTLGLGVASRPSFQGSSTQVLRGTPTLGATYGRYFIGNAGSTGVGIGAYFLSTDNLRLGISVSGGGSPRKASLDPRLTGLGDVASTIRGNLFASYRADWLLVRTNYSTDLGGKAEGTTASFDLDARYRPSDKLSLVAGPGLTWSSAQYAQTFYGVTAAQSASSGLAAYNAGVGVSQVRFTVGADYRLAEQWNLSTRLITSTLKGSAAVSPITQTKYQNSLGISAAYRF